MIVRERGTDNDVTGHEGGVSVDKPDTSTASPRANIGAEFPENIIERACKVGVDTFLKRNFREYGGHEQHPLHTLSMIRRYYKER